MRLVRDDVANDVEDLREPCGRRDCTAADIESARRCNAASVRAHSPAVTVGGVSPRRAKGTWPRRSIWISIRTPIRPGERWRQALQRANTRCEAVICLLSKHWLITRECEVEFRYAENLHKAILRARLESVADANGGEPVVLDSVGLQR